MKLSFSQADVERWRDRTHRRTPKLAVTNERQALAFINSVGFCLASRTNGMELPNLWEAIAGPDRTATGDKKYYLSYAWDIHSILPNHDSVYYGKIFRRRPTLVSREYLPYFYVLAERTGAKSEYLTEFSKGRLSPLAKQIMDVLMRRGSLSTRELRSALGYDTKRSVSAFERALDELQRKMFICRSVGSEQRFGAEWTPLVKRFATEVRKARKISVDQARCKLLEKYFRNQLVSSVESIRNVFGWSKKDIYHAIGWLIRQGIITTCSTFDGKKGTWYCLIR